MSTASFLSRLALLAAALLPALAPRASAQPYDQNYYLHQSNYPVAETNWSNDAQGVAHDDNNWFITNTEFIWKIPVTQDLRTVTATSPGVIRRSLSSYSQLAGTGINHLGDPDVYRHQGIDYLVVPAEQSSATCTSGRTASFIVLRCSDLTFAAILSVSGQCNDAGWVAVRADGHLFSSRQHIGFDRPGERGIREYVINWESLLTTGGTSVNSFDVPLFNEQGGYLDLATMQGGEFAPGENLLYLISGFYSDSNARADMEGIHVIDTITHTRIQHSTRGFGHFDFYYNPGTFTGAEEPEGLTIWDLDDGRAPGIRGQLHAFVLSNEIDAGDIDFKHYTQIIRVNPSSTCQSGTIACPFRTFAGAHTLAWPGADIRLRAGTYLERPIISKKVRLSAEGGLVRLGG